MPLPPVIEIVPLTQPVRAEITVPGSKSITNRALILAALADGRTGCVSGTISMTGGNGIEITKSG